jgi:hypothetical protein
MNELYAGAVSVGKYRKEHTARSVGTLWQCNGSGSIQVPGATVHGGLCCMCGIGKVNNNIVRVENMGGWEAP